MISVEKNVYLDRRRHCRRRMRFYSKRKKERKNKQKKIINNLTKT